LTRIKSRFARTEPALKELGEGKSVQQDNR